MLVLRDVDRLCFQTVRVRQRESRSVQVKCASVDGHPSVAPIWPGMLVVLLFLS